MSKKHVGWWKADETRRGKELCAAATKAMEKDAGRLADCLGGVRHYLNQPITNLTAGGYATSTNEGPVQINLAKSAVDTVWSRFARSLPRTEPVTEDASWGMARQAQRLGRFLDGVKYRNDWKNTAILCLRDSLIVRGGVVQVSSVVEQRNGEAVGRILIERVFPWELFVDAGEAYYGCPRSLYKRRLLDREVAVALFGHDDKGESDEALEEAIRMRARAAGGHDGVSDSQSDQVIVWEGWHLPSAHGSGDGWHITAIEGVDQPVVMLTGHGTVHAPDTPGAALPPRPHLHIVATSEAPDLKADGPGPAPASAPVLTLVSGAQDRNRIHVSDRLTQKINRESTHQGQHDGAPKQRALDHHNVVCSAVAVGLGNLAHADRAEAHRGNAACGLHEVLQKANEPDAGGA